MVERLIARSQLAVRSVLVNAAAHTALRATLDRLPPQTPVYLLNQDRFADVTGYNIHRGCLAIVDRPPRRDLSELLRPPHLVVIVESCSNADNLGGIFRNAAAFGASGVVLSPDTVDPLYRKTVRTSMAASCLVPFVRIPDWPDGLASIKARGYTIAAMTLQPPVETLDDAAARPRPERLAIMVGAEGEGLSAASLACADWRVRIPIADLVDSLNLAVASGIALARLSPWAHSDKR